MKSAPKEERSVVAPPLRSIHPLRLIWVLTTLTLAVVLAYLHAYPQAAYPTHGLSPALGLVVLTAAALLLVARSPWLAPRSLLPILPPCLLLLWAWWRTSLGPVPAEGVPLLGTLLEGCLVFTIALVLAATGRDIHSLSIYEQPDPSEKGTRGGSPRPAAATESAASGGSALFLESAMIFLLILAAAVSLWAVYEYFIRYDQQLYDLQLELRAGGRTFSNFTAQEWALFDLLRAKRVGARFGNPNVLSGFLAMAAPLALVAALRASDRLAKAAALALLGLIWYVVILSGSRGGALTLLLATVAAAAILGREAIRTHRRLLALAAAICLAAIVLVRVSHDRRPANLETPATAQLPSVRYSPFERFWSSPGVAQRLYYWKTGWAMLREAPLWGRGLGAYAALYPQYKQPLARETRYPHNIILQLWVELGVPGLALWGGWFGWVVAAANRRRRAIRNGPLQLALPAFLVAATVFVFNNLFEMTWTFREVYLDWCLVMGLLAGLSTILVRPREEREKKEAGESAATSRPNFFALSLAAVPLLLGVLFANSLIIRPLKADADSMTASDIVQFPLGRNAEAEALRLALRAVRYQPNNPKYHEWLARYYRDRQRSAEARAEFQKAAALNPCSAGVRAEWALLEARERRPDEARRLHTEAIALYPGNARYHQLLAAFELEAGNVEAARRHYRDALQCVLDNRESAAIRADLAALERKNQQPDEARRLLSEAVKLYPPNVRCHALLAELERDAGNFAAAREQLDQGIKFALDPAEKIHLEQLRREIDEKLTPVR